MALDDTNDGFLRAGLLGVESMRRCPTLEGDQTLRQVLRLLPRIVARVEHEGYVRDVTFSPDGRLVALGGGDYGDPDEVRVWEVATGREVACMEHEAPVSAVAFGPDGRWIVSGSHDDTVRVWEAATGREVARVQHGGQVNSVAFSPDGRWVASGSQDGTARVLLWQPEDLMAEMCARLTRNLTVEEWQRYIPGEPYRLTCPDLPVEEN
ncbi:MAG: WD40 repeat domain-containing protein [Anaerolineae bacterium]|nr:WD40 repeat domain-containing protein [Anaerolineae bacterium]